MRNIEHPTIIRSQESEYRRQKSQRPKILYNEDILVKTGIQVILEAFKRFVIPMEMGIQE